MQFNTECNLSSRYLEYDSHEKDNFLFFYKSYPEKLLRKAATCQGSNFHSSGFIDGTNLIACIAEQEAACPISTVEMTKSLIYFKTRSTRCIANVIYDQTVHTYHKYFIHSNYSHNEVTVQTVRKKLFFIETPMINLKTY